MIEKAELEAASAFESKKREAASLAAAARREGERIITDAAREVIEYRQWLSGVISEAERLYKIQTQSLDAAEGAIQQSRSRLETAFVRLNELQKAVQQNLNEDGTLLNRGPINVASERSKPALEAPKRKPAKKAAKKSPPKRK
ncbi:unannotated protein [freshwater metagenome]|uniref:Unannotated protein n=1 Tax=freshwater metagenome TaxID=449393 RepID=A0A6J6F7L1_9ZZZZ